MANGFWKSNTGGGFNSSYTFAQLQTMESGGTLTPHVTYIPSDVGEELVATDASTLTPRDACVMSALPGFGGTWNGTTADDTALQAAIDYAADFTPKRNVMLPPLVCISAGVHVPAGVHILGHEYTPGKMGTTIKPHVSASLTTGFMFNMATEDGTTPDVGSPQLGIAWNCGISGVYLYVVPAAADIRLAVFADTFIAHDIHAYRQTQVFKKVVGEYIDNIEIKRITVGLSYDNSEYAIELGTGGGDAYLLEEFNFPVTGIAGDPELGIKIASGGNGKIANIINGVISIANAFNCAIDKHHCEYGYVLIADSSVRIVDSLYYVDDADSHYPIDCSTGGSNINYHLELDDVMFKYGTGIEGTNTAEIRKADQFSLSVTNCWRHINMVNGQSATVGIRVNNASDAAITDWNNNSWYLSMRGWMLGTKASGSHPTQITTDFNGLYNTPNKITGSGDSSLSNGTTYYYVAQLLIDSALAVGRNQSAAEQSVAMTADNQRVAMAFGWGTGTQAGIVRIYRGTATGMYGYYADIPMMRGLYVADNGAVCNGIPWVDRGGASAVATITSTAAGKWIVTPLGKVVVA